MGGNQSHFLLCEGKEQSRTRQLIENYYAQKFEYFGYLA